MPVERRTKKRHRAYALQVFNAARRQKLISSNPVEEVGYKERKNDAEEITVLTPEQLQRLFACADAEIRPLYAIAAFAGVRWNEIDQLNWEDIKEHEIVISARIAKTRSRRIISIRPALAAFLTERGTGSLLPRIYSARRPSVRRLDFLRARAEKKAGLHPWPRNACRHSFISYALAIDKDQNKIALESGNTPDVIHTNYRALVTREAADPVLENSSGRRRAVEITATTPDRPESTPRMSYRRAVCLARERRPPLLLRDVVGRAFGRPLFSDSEVADNCIQLLVCFFSGKPLL
jgi:integrase